MRSTAAALLLCAGFASCSQDDADSSLQHGKYPLKLTIETILPTPVPTSSQTTRGMVDGNLGTVNVQVDGDVKYYKVGNDGTLTIKSGTAFYWSESDKSKKIKIWYRKPEIKSYPEQWTVHTNQSDSTRYEYSYFLMGEKTVAYEDKDNIITIPLYHQTAKVTINLISEIVPLNKNTTVKLLNVSGISEGTNTITPYHPDSTNQTYHALLTEQTIKAGTEFIKVTSEGYEFYYKLPEEKKFTKGYHYTYNIKLNAKGIEVNDGTGATWSNGGDEAVESEK